ncbi:MAG: hypothetical protein WBI07_03145, partial [Mobilitalea sp.]
MCRFNLIMIRDDSAEEMLKQEDYLKCYDNLYGDRAYQKGYCNCGSFVGSLSENKGMKYNDVLAMRKQEKIERLYQIKNVMNQPEYEAEKEKFLQRRIKLSDELGVHSEYIGDYERKQTELIQKKYSGDELNAQMEKLYQEVGNLLALQENQPEFQKKREEYNRFLKDNEWMNESFGYFLSEEEEKEAFDPGIPLSELLGIKEELNSEEVKIISLEKESSVIDEVIAKVEKDTFAEQLDEFNIYYDLFTKLLKVVES